MAHSASGKPPARSGRKRASSAAGCTRLQTCSPSCRRARSRKPSARCRRSGWLKRRSPPRFDAFIESYALKYEKAADCLSKDRDTLLAFYDFPAEHWKHLRTTNEMDKRFFFMTEMTIAEIAYFHSFVRLRRGPFFRPGHRSRSRRGRAGAVKAGRVCGHRKAWP